MTSTTPTRQDTFPNRRLCANTRTTIERRKETLKYLREMAQDKNTEAAKDTTSLVDAPPSYTPRAASPITPIHPPPPPAESSVTPERVHAPTAPFSNDLVQIGPEPANVVCPRCHYGVRTNTKSRAGTHAGYPSPLSPPLCRVVLTGLVSGLQSVVLHVGLLLRLSPW